MGSKGTGSNGLESGWPSFEGEIDDIKALEFAFAVCVKLASEGGPWGAAKAFAAAAAASIQALIRTAKGFDASAIERQAFLETMLRKDGLAVVIYLEADQVRQSMIDQGHKELAAETPTEAITDLFQEILAGTEGMPQGLASWTTEIEEDVAGTLIRTATKEAGA